MGTGRTRGRTRHGWIALTGWLVLGGCYAGADDADATEQPQPGEDPLGRFADGDCVDTKVAFRDLAWTPILKTRCQGCHNPFGIAAQSDLVLLGPEFPWHIEANFETVRELAQLEIEDGTPYLLAKPSEQIEHPGGLQLLEGSDEYMALAEVIEILREPSTCAYNPNVDRFFDGVVLMGPEETLRKAILALAGRLPTADELDDAHDGGMAGVEAVLVEVMREPAFYEVRLVEMFNDLLHTDAFLPGDDAVETVDMQRFPNARWFDAIEDDDARATARARTNRSIAREPLQLISYIAEQQRPFSEILTADYVMITPYSAQSYGVDLGMFDDPDDPNEWRPSSFDDATHAGLLSTSVFLNRYPSSPTNRNRGRARFVYDAFLAFDILSIASRPIDSMGGGHNPTAENPNCTVCHVTLDPVAGAFQNWDDVGRYRPPEAWYEGMASPGLYDTVLPQEERPRALAWLAEQIVADERFALAVVHILFKGLTGQDPLDEPDTTDPTYPAFEAQHARLRHIAAQFRASSFDLRVAVMGIVKSEYFRAIGTSSPVNEQRAAELASVGVPHLLSPEQLHRRIVATTGYAWKRGNTNVLLSGNLFKFLYGGIDSASVTERQTEPSGVMAAIVDRMAIEHACRVTALDFAKPTEERMLFGRAELSDLPGEPLAEATIRLQLMDLYQHVLGETLDPKAPEIDRAYALLVDARQHGLDAIASGDADMVLPADCQAIDDPVSGPIGVERQIVDDEQFTVRAWMTVVAYLLADFRFMYG